MARKRESINAIAITAIPIIIYSATAIIIDMSVIMIYTSILLLISRVIFRQATADAHSHTFDVQIVDFLFGVGHRRKPRILWL